MKNIFYLLLLGPILVYSQSENQNYVRTDIYTTINDNAAQARKIIIYYDGLGRPIQQVAGKASANSLDIITHIEYDQYNRQPKEYLPFESVSNLMEFDNSARENTESFYFKTKYDNATNPYTEQIYEASPLNRLVKQGAPGNNWKVSDNNDHSVKYDYQINIAREVRLFKVVFTEGDTESPTLVTTGYYGAGQLYKSIVKDELWINADGKYRTTEEFKDKEGRLVLKRKFDRVSNVLHAGNYTIVPHDTYYIYDDYSNLTYVIPPLAADKIVKESFATGSIFVNVPWTKLFLVDKATKDDFEAAIINIPNSDILNVDLSVQYGGKGGIKLEFNGNGEISLQLNLLSNTELELVNGEILSLASYGKFSDRELGRITTQDAEYYFLIQNNSLVINGYGKISNIIGTFNGATPLEYQRNFPWTSLLNVDKQDQEIIHYNDIIDTIDNSEILSSYIPNSFEGRGGATILFLDDDTFTINLNIQTNKKFEFAQGALFTLDTKRPIPDAEIGTIETADYKYVFTVRNNILEIKGQGEFTNIIFNGTVRNNKIYSIQNEAEQLCYIYHYDRRNRVIEKHIPDNGWTKIVYDKLDRPVLIQDETALVEPNWIFKKYDVFGRIAFTGKVSVSMDRSEIQNNYDNGTFATSYEQRSGENYYFEQDGAKIYYTDNLFPQNAETLKVNYYDDITFDTKYSVPSNTNSNVAIPGNSYATFTTRRKGLQTGCLVKVLPGTTNASGWITSVTEYDEKARPIFTYSHNSYLSAWHMVESNLDFIGKVVETKTQHKTGSNAKVTLYDFYTYDSADRPLTHNQLIGEYLTGNRQLISDISYEALGAMKQKSVGGSFPVGVSHTSYSPWQTMNYSQNIRGWLTAVNDVDEDMDFTNKMFAFKIDYLMNGNISGTSWKNQTDLDIKSYAYTYDGLNRLKEADYVNRGNIYEEFHEKNIKYDKNGNIQSLTRWGKNSYNGFSKLDDLVYTPQVMSNRLLSVLDNINGDDGFVDGNKGSNDYDYDSAGNLTKDLNKGISLISYNHLNLPSEVIKNSDHKIQYVYDASGVKLEKKVTNGTIVTTTNYSFGFVYTNGQLEYFSHNEGFVERTADQNFQYIYQYKDHLGNVRLSYTNSPNGLVTKDNNDYYPFGMKHGGGLTFPVSSAGKIKYNSMELQDELGLNWYDYEARNYDPQLGRWFNTDPMAEVSRRFSPYTYALDNPVYFVDPDGMWADAFGERGGVNLAGASSDGSVGFLSELGADIAGVKTTTFFDVQSSPKEKAHPTKNDRFTQFLVNLPVKPSKVAEDPIATMNINSKDPEHNALFLDIYKKMKANSVSGDRVFDVLSHGSHNASLGSIKNNIPNNNMTVSEFDTAMKSWSPAYAKAVADGKPFEIWILSCWGASKGEQNNQIFALEFSKMYPQATVYSFDGRGYWGRDFWGSPEFKGIGNMPWDGVSKKAMPNNHQGSLVKYQNKAEKSRYSSKEALNIVNSHLGL